MNTAEEQCDVRTQMQMIKNIDELKKFFFLVIIENKPYLKVNNEFGFLPRFLLWQKYDKTNDVTTLVQSSY